MERKYEQHGQNSMFQDDGILPEDILIDILLRVAARHLARLRFVCKSWCSLIDNVNFIDRHYRLHYSICKADGDNSFLCDGFRTNDLPYYDLKVSLVSKHTGDAPLDLTPNLLVDSAPSFTDTPNIFAEASVVFVVKGVVCIFWRKYHDLGLWNPATREFKALTPWESCRTQNCRPELIGFGFDCISNDFKTLRGNRYQDGTPYYELHSLKTNSWKRLRESAPVLWIGSYLMEAYLNGVGYWIVYASDTPDTPSFKFYGRVPLILSFNFHTQVFEVFNLPDDASVRETFPYFYVEALTVYKERLTFVLERADTDIGEFHFDVWTVTQVDANSGTPLSWQHLFTSRPFRESEFLHFKAFRMDGNMVVSLYDPSCTQRPRKYVHRIYNPTTDTFKKCVYTQTPDTFHNTSSERCIYFEYVESLFPLSESRKLIFYGP